MPGQRQRRGIVPARASWQPETRAASALAGLVNTSRPALLRSASASSSSASDARSMRSLGSTVCKAARPAARYRDNPNSSGTRSRGSSTATRPAVLSRSGPSYGATTTTRAPLRTPIAAAPTSAGSPGSSPATISTSSGPTQGGAALASTIGSAAPAPSVEARMVPAVSAVPGRSPRSPSGDGHYRAASPVRPRRPRQRWHAPVRRPSMRPAAGHPGRQRSGLRCPRDRSPGRRSRSGLRMCALGSDFSADLTYHRVNVPDAAALHIEPQQRLGV